MPNFTQWPFVKNLIHNGAVEYGQFQRVECVNYVDAHITTPSGKVLSTKQKQRKKNQFCFIGLHHERFIIGVAVVDLSLASNGFVYVYDKQTHSLIECSKLNPFGLSTQLSSHPNQGDIRFKNGKLKIHMAFSSQAIQLRIHSPIITLDTTITPSQQPMCLCTRTGYTGWVYMQKQNALACTGKAHINGQAFGLTPQNCRAGIDWTLGYMTRETFWNWSSINTTLDNGDTLGLNLVCGVNDTSFTENACWLNDVLINMPLTIFDYNPRDVMQLWRIHSNTQTQHNAHVDLTFTPKHRREDHTNAVVMASHFSQLIGTYSGTITLPERTLILNGVWGLAEDHYAKW